MSTKSYSIGHSEICTLLGFIHTVLLAIGVYPLIASCGGLSGKEFWYIFSLGFFMFIVDILAWIALRKIRLLLVYLLTGLCISVVFAIITFLLSRSYPSVRYYVGAATFLLSMAIFLIHSSAHIKHSDMKEEFLATHGADIPFRMKVWEVPTFLTQPSLACFAWFVAQYLLGLILRQPLYWHAVFYLTLADLFVYFIYTYIHHFVIFLQDNHASANLPIKTMRRVHLIILGIGILLLTLFTVPSILYNREPLSELSFNDVLAPMEENPQDITFMPSVSPNYSTDLSKMINDVEKHELPVALLYLINALLVLVVICFLVGLVWSIVYAIRNAIHLFAIQDEDEMIFLEDETADVTESSYRKRVSAKNYFSVNQQIRRRYKKTIRRATSGTPDYWATPSELEAHAGLDESDGINVLHEVYEKARYSKNGAVKEDLKKL